jgi:hypothetical protein
MYIAKFQDHNDYWLTIDHVSLDDAIKFLNRQIDVQPAYKNAFIKEQETGREIFSYRTIK